MLISKIQAFKKPFYYRILFYKPLAMRRQSETIILVDLANIYQLWWTKTQNV